MTKTERKARPPSIRSLKKELKDLRESHASYYNSWRLEIGKTQELEDQIKKLEEERHAYICNEEYRALAIQSCAHLVEAIAKMIGGPGFPQGRR